MRRIFRSKSLKSFPISRATLLRHRPPVLQRGRKPGRCIAGRNSSSPRMLPYTRNALRSQPWAGHAPMSLGTTRAHQRRTPVVLPDPSHSEMILVMQRPLLPRPLLTSKKRPGPLLHLGERAPAAVGRHGTRLPSRISRINGARC
jgi:hypothetical protein